MVSSGRGIFSESTARGGRESGFATDEQHRNRKKVPSSPNSAERLNPPSFPQNQKTPSARRAAPVWSVLQMVSYGRGIFSESTARGGRESGFATDEQHRNREKDPSPQLRRAAEPSFLPTKPEDTICRTGLTKSLRRRPLQGPIQQRAQRRWRRCTRHHRIPAAHMHHRPLPGLSLTLQKRMRLH